MLSGIQSGNKKPNLEASKSNVANKIIDEPSIKKTEKTEKTSPTKVAKIAPQTKQEESPCVSSESDLVSSTNRDDEDDYQFQSQSSEKDSRSEDKNSESASYEEGEQSQSECADSKSESTTEVTSQELSEENIANGLRSNSEDFDADDSDDVRERRNPKLCVEREIPQPLEDTNKPKNFQHFQRNRHGPRGMMPRQMNPMYPMPGNNDNFNQFMPQYRGPRRPMGPPSEFMRNHTISMMRPPGPHRMPMHGMPPHRLGPPNVGMPHQRMQRPPFQSSPMFNPGMPPQGKFRMIEC